MAALIAELAALYKKYGGIVPARVVSWAKAHPGSELHSRFCWDDTQAAERYRLWQARELITEVEVEYSDGTTRQIYVSPMSSRGRGGYSALVDVMSNARSRAAFLSEALVEYERVGARYRDLMELARVRRAVNAVVKGKSRRRAQA